MHVAHLEARALAREAAGTERREPPLVRDFRQRIRLVHELRQLRRPEELANRGHDRLRVDQVVRHGRRHFLVDGHLFLDRPLHADQPDAELVLEQLADRPHAAVAEVVDVVDERRVLAQLQQVPDDLVEVGRVQHLLVERRVQLELGVQLQPADAREVVLLRVEEHVLEERCASCRASADRPAAGGGRSRSAPLRASESDPSSASGTGPGRSRPSRGRRSRCCSTFFSCAIAMTRSESSSLASRMTSPVDGSIDVGGRERALALGVDELDRRRRRPSSAPRPDPCGSSCRSAAPAPSPESGTRPPTAGRRASRPPSTATLPFFSDSSSTV